MRVDSPKYCVQSVKIIGAALGRSIMRVDHAGGGSVYFINRATKGGGPIVVACRSEERGLLIVDTGVEALNVALTREIAGGVYPLSTPMQFSAALNGVLARAAQYAASVAYDAQKSATTK